jgi:uncharacterized protein (DUF433 family)
VLSHGLTNLPDFLAKDDLGFVHFAGHRIGLHHVIRLYNDGSSPEGIVESLPSLSLLQVHKAIVYYLENQALVDAYVSVHDEHFQREMATSPKTTPTVEELRRRFEAMRRARAS